MIEQIKFDRKDKNFQEVLKKVNKLSENFTSDQQKTLEQNANFDINLPEQVTFVDIDVDTANIDENSYNYFVLITDKGVKYSANRIFDIALIGGKNSELKFKPSRARSKLQGAGVLDNTNSINTELLNFAALHGLKRSELIASLLNKPLKTESINVVTYYPDVSENESVTDDKFSANALNEAFKNKQSIAGLKYGKKYRFTFAEPENNKK